MENFWYLIKVIPGKERSLTTQLNQQISLGKIKNVKRFVCPTEEEYLTVRKKKVIREKVIYSGYLYFETETKLNNDELKEISMIPNIMSMMGDKSPILMSNSDVKKIIKDDILDNHVQMKKTIFSIGEKVTISEGPFSGFFGTISQINDEKVDVIVKIFGRDNTVTLSLHQVKRVY